MVQHINQTKLTPYTRLFEAYKQINYENSKPDSSDIIRGSIYLFTYKHLVMKKLKVTFVIILLSLSGYTQIRILVADETELVMFKTGFKIETCNEKVFKLILSDLKYLATKYTVSINKSKHGAYNSYSVPFKLNDINKVKAFFNKIN